MILGPNIEIIRGAIPFNFKACDVGPKASKLEEFEINRELKAGFIELSDA